MQIDKRKIKYIFRALICKSIIINLPYSIVELRTLTLNMKNQIKVDIVSDVVCPWCYIGKRRLELAIAQLENEIDFKVDYIPFELNPGSENSNQHLFDYLAEKYGSADHVEQMSNKVEAVAHDLGIEMNFKNINFTANTLMAHQLLEFVTNSQEKSKLKEALLKAYFTHNIHVGIKDNLIKIAKEAQISDEIIAQFNNTNNTKQVEERQNSIKKAGINSVPSFIINDQFLIQGAQETEVFIKAFTDISKEK